jgi:hypothetical protein
MLVSHFCVWEEHGRLWSRLGTNATEALLLKRLRVVGLGDAAEHMERHKDLLRLNGGSYVLVRWNPDVTRALLAELLPKV